MSVRTFMFCDICNPQGIRCPEQRRTSNRDGTGGRRVTDGRSWFEGDADTAILEYGWQGTAGGLHVCPHCAERELHLRHAEGK